LKWTSLPADAPDRHCRCCGQIKAADQFYPTYKTQCKACLKPKEAANRMPEECS